MKSKKSALLLSFTSLLLCFAMLAGSTFAWFTDTATTGVNKIQAGNLDVQLFYANTATGSEEGVIWTEVTAETNLKFLQKDASGNVGQKDFYWEPGGFYSLPALKIVNNGNLKLKYKILINGIKGEAKLNEVIDWTMKLDGTDFVLGSEHTLDAKPAEGESADILTISGHMQETAGNTYQNATIEGITITVTATQATGEFDSYDDQYDKFADYPEVQPVTTADKLQEALASEDIDGKTIKLYDNIETEGLQLTGKNVAFDLNGKSLNTKKLEVNNSTVVFGDSSENGGGTLATDDSYGVINAVDSNVTIENGQFVSTYDTGTSGYAPVIQARNSELTINGGHFENTDGVGSYNYLIKAPSYNTNEKTTITINGGEFVSHRNYGYIIAGDGRGNVDVVINGGTFTTEGNNSYLTNVNGNVVVNDCTFTAGNSVVFNIPKGYTATVKGGTFSVNNKSGFFSHNKTTGWVSDFTGTLLVDPIKPVKINQETYSGFFANGATQSAKGADGFYTISK